MDVVNSGRMQPPIALMRLHPNGLAACLETLVSIVSIVRGATMLGHPAHALTSTLPASISHYGVHHLRTSTLQSTLNLDY